MVETRRLTELEGRLQGLLDLPDGNLLLGLSGGADSAALGHLLVRSGRRARALHVNHGLPASAVLEKAATAICDRLGLELNVLEVEVPRGASAEGQARTARYEALLAATEEGSWLLTAHTLDDQAETVMLNLLRGAGPSGLTGIPARRGRVARPMLRVRRAETRELAGLAGLPFLDDPGNIDPRNRRNTIRRDVLPDLSARFNVRLVESLARTATLLGAAQAQLDGSADQVELLTGEGEVAVAIGVLAAVPDPVADIVIRRCLSTIRPPHSGTASEVEAVRAVAARRRVSARLAGDIEIVTEGPLLVFRLAGEKSGPGTPVDLEVGVNEIDGFELVVDRVDAVCRAAPVGPWGAIFDPGVSLRAVIDAEGRLIVEADGEPAWWPGNRRMAVAWYRPGSSGYLSVFARERSGWTSSP